MEEMAFIYMACFYCTLGRARRISSYIVGGRLLLHRMICMEREEEEMGDGIAKAKVGRHGKRKGWEDEEK